MNLLELIKNGLAYDSSWGVYAEKVGGMFSAQSPARIGQRILENEGLLDDCEFFDSNESILDSIASWYGDFEPWVFDEAEWNQWVLLFEASGAEQGGSRRDVIDFIFENHTERYDNLRQKSDEFNVVNFQQEAIENLIQERNAYELENN